MEINKDLLPGQEDFWQGYQTSIDKSKEDPRLIEFDRLCFEVFEKTEAGKKLLEYLIETIVMPGTPSRDTQAFPMTCVYYEGQRDCIRLLRQSTRSYRERKEAEDKRIIEKASKEPA